MVADTNTSVEDVLAEFGTKLAAPVNFSQVAELLSALDTLRRDRTVCLHQEVVRRVEGSADRGTLCAVDPGAAVDIFLPVEYGSHYQYYKKFGAKYFARHVALQLERRQGLHFSQYGNWFADLDTQPLPLRLIPFFPLDDGDYAYPSPTGGWVRSRPGDYSAYVGSLDEALGGRFKAIVRMIKCWNVTCRYRIRGFHLETMLAQHFFEDPRPYTYDSMLTGFFERLPTYLSQPSLDPTTKNRLAEYLGVGLDQTLRENVIKLATKATVAARRAFGMRDDYPIESLHEWRLLFGKHFPRTKKAPRQASTSSAS